MAPFLSKTIKATDEEHDFLKFIRDNYFLPEITKEYNVYVYDRLSQLMREKNALIDQGESGQKLEDVLLRIANVELYAAKWQSMIKRYENQ